MRQQATEGTIKRYASNRERFAIRCGLRSDLRLLVSLVFALQVAVCSPTSAAQQPKRIARIGYLSALSVSSESTRADAIRLALRELGYVEGQNIAIDYRYSDGNPDSAAKLAAELVQ